MRTTSRSTVSKGSQGRCDRRPASTNVAQIRSLRQRARYLLEGIRTQIRSAAKSGDGGLRVAVIDYGSGNLHSARKALEKAASKGASAQIEVTSDPEAILRADRVVLPGVGAFGDCKRGLDRVSGLVEALEESVLSKGRPFLGICVGMQLLATRGLEHEETLGLGWIGGVVTPLTPA